MNLAETQKNGKKCSFVNNFGKISVKLGLHLSGNWGLKYIPVLFSPLLPISPAPHNPARLPVQQLASP